MEKNFIEEGDIVVVELIGDVIGGPDAGSLNEKIHDYAQKSINKFVVDLSQVELMNSSGLGMLIGAMTTLRNTKGDLVLVNVTERIKNLLNITKLSSVFKSFDSIDDAKDFLN